ncbi:hypothetical protein AcV5_001237 [Taiwanofungus camphoratus]|nr:hypothetical protein AcW2_006144 [Antrodia cinnamomea]KAI0938042.1 hypothetical protein AcV7_003347 [Antrodia cinnamomea]KAI0940016.1 hypothetical protein AcV5_001237 [Antrodia cinnamomea]
MEYRPRYTQPFTLEEATQMEVSVITEEIARLQNSLLHLGKTQDELREASASTPDAEFTKAMEENETVIGSQEERISILRMALTEKGVRMGSHYDVADIRTNSRDRLPEQSSLRQFASTVNPNTSNETRSTDDEDGIHL